MRGSVHGTECRQEFLRLRGRELGDVVNIWHTVGFAPGNQGHVGGQGFSLFHGVGHDQLATYLVAGFSNAEFSKLGDQPGVAPVRKTGAVRAGWFPEK